MTVNSTPARPAKKEGKMRKLFVALIGCLALAIITIACFGTSTAGRGDLTAVASLDVGAAVAPHADLAAPLSNPHLALAELAVLVVNEPSYHAADIELQQIAHVSNRSTEGNTSFASYSHLRSGKYADDDREGCAFVA